MGSDKRSEATYFTRYTVIVYVAVQWSIIYCSLKNISDISTVPAQRPFNGIIIASCTNLKE